MNKSLAPYYRAMRDAADNVYYAVNVVYTYYGYSTSWLDISGAYIESYNVQGMYGYYDVPMDVDITLKKSSANTTLTSGNSCYSLDGTQYGLYTDSSCNNRVHVFTTDANGDSGTYTVSSPGTYYYKEIKAGPGYILDETVGSITIYGSDLGGPTKVINTSNQPLSDPLNMYIRKISSVNGDLISDRAKVAVFKVEHFPNNSWNSTGKRTWYFKTINGYVNFGNASFLADGYDSDDLYRTGGGAVTYPLGTIQITEEEAPVGYLKTNLAVKGRIIEDEDSASGVTSRYSQVREQRRSFHL